MVRSPATETKERALAHDRILHKGPVDMIHLAKQTLGDHGLEQEVLRLFDETARVYFGRIEHSTSVDELLYHLHTLKGAAAGVGARAIADLARTAEEDLRAGKPVDPERIEDLHMAVTECSDWIERVLPKDEDWGPSVP
jgi:HPt (histidine-containing phosphotransfer) domain-containing protein